MENLSSYLCYIFTVYFPTGFSGVNCEIGGPTPATTPAPPTTTADMDLITFVTTLIGGVSGMTDEELEQFIALILQTAFNIHSAGALGKYQAWRTLNACILVSTNVHSAFS